MEDRANSGYAVVSSVLGRRVTLVVLEIIRCGYGGILGVSRGLLQDEIFYIRAIECCLKTWKDESGPRGDRVEQRS